MVSYQGDNLDEHHKRRLQQRHDAGVDPVASCRSARSLFQPFAGETESVDPADRRLSLSASEKYQLATAASESGGSFDSSALALGISQQLGKAF